MVSINFLCGVQFDGLSEKLARYIESTADILLFLVSLVSRSTAEGFHTAEWLLTRHLLSRFYCIWYTSGLFRPSLRGKAGANFNFALSFLWPHLISNRWESLAVDAKNVHFAQGTTVLLSGDYGGNELSYTTEALIAKDTWPHEIPIMGFYIVTCCARISRKYRARRYFELKTYHGVNLTETILCLFG